MKEEEIENFNVPVPLLSRLSEWSHILKKLKISSKCPVAIFLNPWSTGVAAITWPRQMWILALAPALPVMFIVSAFGAECIFKSQ